MKKLCFFLLLSVTASFLGWADVQYYENTTPLSQFSSFPQNYFTGSYGSDNGIVVQNASTKLKGNLKSISTTINFNPITFVLKDTDMAGNSPAYRSLFIGTGGAYGLQTIYTQGLYSGSSIPAISGTYSVSGPTQTRNGTFSVGINTVGISLPDFINLSNPSSEMIFSDGLHINEHLSGFKITPWGSDNMAIFYSVVDDVNLAVGLTINQFTSSSQFALQAIPEPSSISLLAFGGVVMALRRRR